MAQPYVEAEIAKLNAASRAVLDESARLVIAVSFYPRPPYNDEAQVLDRAIQALVAVIDGCVDSFLEAATAAARRRADEAGLDPDTLITGRS